MRNLQDAGTKARQSRTLWMGSGPAYAYPETGNLEEMRHPIGTCLIEIELFIFHHAIGVKEVK